MPVNDLACHAATLLPGADLLTLTPAPAATTQTRPAPTRRSQADARGLRFGGAAKGALFGPDVSAAPQHADPSSRAPQHSFKPRSTSARHDLGQPASQPHRSELS